MTKRRGWAEDYAGITTKDACKAMEEARTRNAAGRGCGRKPDQQRPQQIVSGGTKQREEQRESQNLLESPALLQLMPSHRQVDVWSKSVSKTHHGGGLWSSEVAGLIASPATNMHQGPADGKLIKGPRILFGFPEVEAGASWPSRCMFQPSVARSPTSSAVRLAADCWSRRAMASGGFQVPACVIHC